MLAQGVDKPSAGKLLLTLLLAVTHMLAGLAILLLSSWFIAACSIAGVGFNYMLPAVLVRALALIRIASGYFSMLFGHSHLLDALAAIRLQLFAGLRDKVSIDRKESLDSLHHQSEEVASIWMSWVGQNAGALLSLLLLNVVCSYLLPDITLVLVVFSAAFFAVYSALLLALLRDSSALLQANKALQFGLVQHVEAAPLWHLYHDYGAQAPTTLGVQHIIGRMQLRIRLAILLVFLAAIAAVGAVLLWHSPALRGEPLFLVVPVALLAINDWLSPVLGNQQQLLAYLEARRSIDAANRYTNDIERKAGNIQRLAVSAFKAEATCMPGVDAEFTPGSATVIVGSSGSGKSRLLQALSGLLPFAGQREVTFESSAEQLRFTAQGLLVDSFYVQQFPCILSDTLAENLRIAKPDASDAMLQAVLRQVGLGYLGDLKQWLGDHGRPLSGGEQKRLGLARAVLSDATYLLLDEPFEALDQANICKVTGLINTLAMDKCVVVATHIVPSALAYQQQIALEPDAATPVVALI